MHDYTRTDLACEWGRQSSIAGTEFFERKWSHGVWQVLRILTPEAAGRLGRPVGEYVTVNCGKIWKLDAQAREALERTVAKLLVQLLTREVGREPDPEVSVLVVGLGNRDITADAIGPRAIGELLVTRHLREQMPRLFRDMACCAVSAIAPGVLGQTGMETLEVIRGAVRASHPNVLIVIDALAARSCERLASTLQLSNTGISPGAGVGNQRHALGKKTLGVPVIALGVPTVVDSSTLVYDALRQAGIEQVDDRLRAILENGKRFYVSPKEADLIAGRTATLLAHAINRALVGVPTLS